MCMCKTVVAPKSNGMLPMSDGDGITFVTSCHDNDIVIVVLEIQNQQDGSVRLLGRSTDTFLTKCDIKRKIRSESRTVFIRLKPFTINC